MLKSRVFLWLFSVWVPRIRKPPRGLSPEWCDPAGAVVPVAQVTVVNTAKRTMRTTMTDA